MTDDEKAIIRGRARALGEWTGDDSMAALHQGWDVFETDERGLEIERVDDPSDIPGYTGDEMPIFKNDDEAEAFVNRQAEAGDGLAIKALAIIADDQLGRAPSLT